MFTQLSQSFRTAALVLGFATVASAQIFGGMVGGTNGGLSSGGSNPPNLPPVESRANSYSRTIGNSWLGGSLTTYAGMVRQKNGTYELGNASLELRANASVLQRGAEVAELVGSASNVMNNGVQSRSGYFRIRMLGVSVVNQSFTNSSTFASASSTYNLLPNGVSASIPVGPTSVTIRGNAGCGYSRSANWLLPAATATVGVNAQAGAYAFANASVSVGVPGFNVGVGLQGKIMEQTLAANVSASSIWGLSGGVTYTLKAISLRLYAWATALYTWTTTLTTWSAGQATINLI